MPIDLYPNIAKIKRNGVYQNLPGFVLQSSDVNIEAMIANSEISTTAQYAHPEGSYFILNDVLYKTIIDIAVNDTIAVGTNCEVAVLGNDILNIENDVDELKQRLINIGYITPEMFGAIGNGVDDDTISLRNSLKYSIENGKKLLLSKKYYITESLLSSNDYSTNITINIEGIRPEKNYIYSVDIFGGIIFKNGTNVFDGLNISGSINRVSFTPVSRTQTGSIFYNCHLRAFTFSNCSVANILAFCYNTSVGSVTQIKDNRFLTVYYFGKCTESKNFVDSQITGNYINGGEELTDNNCFEWKNWNGSSVENNFIDYYRTIYHPISSASTGFQGPISCCNHYQVFRYLYDEGINISQGEFNSSNDCFNWTNPSSLTKLSSYTPIKYTDPYSVEHDYPPYIACSFQTWKISIQNAIIQGNVGNIIFIRHSLLNYAYAFFDVKVCGDINKYSYDSYVSGAPVFWMNGSYKFNTINIQFIKQMESIPTDNNQWNAYYIGQKILVNNKIYKRICSYDQTNETWKLEWKDISEFI